MSFQSIPAISVIRHYGVTSLLKHFPQVQTVLDVGGNGRTSAFGTWQVTNANIREGVDGCALPYADKAFDATVSIATVEHVSDQAAFLSESLRVCRSVSIHWYPAGEAARGVEALTKRLGYSHPCEILDVPDSWRAAPFGTVGEQLLLLASLYPYMNVPELHDHVIEHGSEPYGFIVMRER